MTQVELADKIYEQCKQVVKSFGGNVQEAHRVALVEMMDHFKQLTIKELTNVES